MSSTTTWADIQRLARDFQQIQLIDSIYKLSDRNCVQLVNKLTALNLINIYHTIDGKEYITDEQIRKEIYDEIHINEGRVNIINLQNILNVDINHIEKKVYEIIKNDPDLILTMGQIISKTYINKIAEEINDLLQERTFIPIAELSTYYELSTEFLVQMITQRLGTLIKGFLDNQILYTEEYINKNKSILAGCLEASIKPVLITQIIKDNGLESKMCFNALNTLINEKQISGQSGKQDLSVYIPEIYTTAQKTYADSFFKQNGYLEYRTLKNIGITEPEKYIKSSFGEANVHQLSTCCVSSYLLHQVESNVEDSIRSYGYCDVSSILPSSFNDKDALMIVNYLMNKSDDISQLKPILLDEKIIISEEYKKKLIDELKDEMEQKANNDLKNPNVLLALRTNITSSAASNTTAASTPKSSSKTKGKDKSKKQTTDSKHQQASNIISDFDDLNFDLSFINENQLKKKLSTKSKDIPDDVTELLAGHIINILNQKYVELLYNKFDAGNIEAASSSTDGNNQPKNLFKDTQDKIKTLLIHAKIFDNSIKKFQNEKGQDLLKKHLTKTVCNDMSNLIFKYVSHENALNVIDDYNTDARNKVIQKVKEPLKGLLVQLNSAISEKSCSEIITLIESTSSNIFELQIKKTDAKKKKVLLELKNSLSNQIEKETDPATILQVASILIYYSSTNVMLNPPGKCVPLIIDSLKIYLKDDSYQNLIDLQNMVTKSAAINPEIIEQIKSIALNTNEHLKSTTK